MFHFMKKVFFILLLTTAIHAENSWLKGLSVYPGFLDRSGHAFVLGANYVFRPDNLFSPKLSAFISDNNMFYLSIGPRLKYKRFYISVGPGYYHEGSGVDLGYDLEFKEEIGYEIVKNIHIGMFHLSNAGLSSYNPGVNALFISFSGF
ncbi:MAG: hypothetical protein CMF41_02855 [Legionellales bacterium]|nr:hypothetical protein [Legionellales bacterium]